jgi:hypothetical protein
MTLFSNNLLRPYFSASMHNNKPRRSSLKVARTSVAFFVGSGTVSRDSEVYSLMRDSLEGSGIITEFGEVGCGGDDEGSDERCEVDNEEEAAGEEGILNYFFVLLMKKHFSSGEKLFLKKDYENSSNNFEHKK